MHNNFDCILIINCKIGAFAGKNGRITINVGVSLCKLLFYADIRTKDVNQQTYNICFTSHYPSVTIMKFTGIKYWLGNHND